MIFSCTKDEIGNSQESAENGKLKRRTISTYHYKYSELDDEPILVQHWVYNDEGLLSTYIMDKDIEAYSYNEKGLLVEKIDNNFTRSDYRHRYEYNAKNQCIKERITHVKDTVVIERKHFTYDQNGFLIERSTTMSGTNLVEVFYKNEAGLDTLVIADHSFFGISEHRYTYDFMGNVLTCDLFEAKKNEHNNKYTNTYEYDSDGKLLRKTIAWGYGFHKGSTYMYEYNYMDNDSIERIKIYSVMDDQQFNAQSIEMYEYEYY